MQYNFKNISVNVNTINPEWVELTGETILTIPKNTLIRLIKESCTFIDYAKNDDLYELWNEAEENEDELINILENLTQKNFEIRNADAIIGIYEFCLENQNETFSFDVETQNISWVIHDILHAQHDTAGCTIYVESSVEKERIIESLRITKEQFPEELPDFMFLEKLEDEFYNRFKVRIDLDEFKEIEDYEEEDYY